MNRISAKKLIRFMLKEKLGIIRNEFNCLNEDSLDDLLEVLNNDGLLYLLNRCVEAFNGTKNRYEKIGTDAFDETSFEFCFPRTSVLQQNNTYSEEDEIYIKNSFIEICNNFLVEVNKDSIKDALKPIESSSSENKNSNIKTRIKGFMDKYLPYNNPYGLTPNYSKPIKDSFIQDNYNKAKFETINNLLKSDEYKNKFFDILYANKVMGPYNGIGKNEKDKRIKYLKENNFEEFIKDNKPIEELTLNLSSSEKMKWDSCKILNSLEVIADRVNNSTVISNKNTTMQKIIEFVHDNNTDSIELLNRLSESDILLDCFYNKYIKELKENEKIKLPKYWKPKVRDNYETNQAKEVWEHTPNKEGIYFYSNIASFKEGFNTFIKEEGIEIGLIEFSDILSKFIDNYKQKEIDSINNDKSLSDSKKKDRIKIIEGYFSNWDNFEVIFDAKKFNDAKNIELGLEYGVMLQNKNDFTRHPGWDLGHLPCHEYKIMHLVYLLTDLFEPKFQENAIKKNDSYIKDKKCYNDDLKKIESNLENCKDENEKIKIRNEILKKQNEILKAIDENKNCEDKSNLTNNPEDIDTENKKEELKNHLREIIKNIWLKYSLEGNKDVIFKKILQDYNNYEAEASSFNRGHKGDTKLSNAEIFEVILEIENEFKTGAIKWEK